MPAFKLGGSYDALGRLWQVQKGATTTRFQYDGDQLIAEYDGADHLLRYYADGPGTDEPLVWYEGAAGTSDRRWLLADERGSIAAVTNGSGASLATNTYDEYGLPGSGNLGWFQYTGQAWLPEVGLYDYKARIYSPSLGRFLQPDPIGYADGMNAYIYAHGDPVNGTDPSGMDLFAFLDPALGSLLGGSGYLDNFSTQISGVTVTGYLPAKFRGVTPDATPSFSSGEVIFTPGKKKIKSTSQSTTVSGVTVTAKRQSRGIDLSKLGSCLGGSALDYYGLTSAAGVSSLLAIPIPKSIVPPFRSIGTPTTNLFSVLGHYVDISVPAVTVAGRTSTNLFRIAGRLNPYVAAGLFAVDAAVVGYNTYQCYNGQ